MKRKLVLLALSFMLTFSFTVPAIAVENIEQQSVDINSVGVISYDSESGITIYRDSAGGTVVSGVMTPYVASDIDRHDQLEILKSIDSIESDNADYKLKRQSNYVDYEYNPIYIGTWSGTACYARHTLGSYNSNLKYLTSYGYATWYNTKGYTALPYRNGQANASGQSVADVIKGSYFDIRDLSTDRKLTLVVNDWGPNQNVAPDRIVDLDKYDFSALHGNYSDGVFYCRTWVPINNYNP